MVPAPAITAGIVNTPVPMMLPTTSPVADVNPKVCAFFWLRGDSGDSGSPAELDGSGGRPETGSSVRLRGLTRFSDRHLARTW